MSDETEDQPAETEGTDNLTGPPCARCNHAPEFHMKTRLATHCVWPGIDGCDCQVYVAPSDGSILEDTSRDEMQAEVLMPVRVTVQAEKMMVSLLRTGLYGHDLSAVAQNLIYDRLLDLQSHPLLRGPRT